LITAVEESGLSEPFVYVDNLGDFSVTYKIHGLLTDVNKYFTTHSLLNRNVMDNLHKGKVEIVSPSFMNQRQVNDSLFIPSITQQRESVADEKLPEETIFDKAIEADKIEEKSEYLEKLEKKIEDLKLSIKTEKDISKEDKTKLIERIERLEESKKRLIENIDEQKTKLDEQK
jgi:hypothetical protein